MKRTIALVCACGLIAAVVVAVVVLRGGDSPAPVAAPAGLPISPHKPRVARLGGVFIDDIAVKPVGQTSVTLLALPGRHTYRLTVRNASDIGFVNAFHWYPPGGVPIVKVIRSDSGHCDVQGTALGGNQFAGAVLNPNIFCRDVSLEPPTCTCRSDGGSANITFTASRAIPASGLTQVTSMTPILKIIPSSLPSKVAHFCGLPTSGLHCTSTK